MNPPGDGKPEPADPDQLLRMLDVELMQQRVARQQIAARRKNRRALSILFLLVILGGAAVAAYFAFATGRVDDLRARNSLTDTATPTPTPSPSTRP
ncbi:MAG: hypothetical protein ACJ8M4_00170 [Chthoniobacterales bacterium]